jgi:hypothetical protein
VPDAGGWSAVDATDSVKGVVMVPVSGGLEVSSGSIGLPTQAGVTPGSATKVTVDAHGVITATGSITGADLTSGEIGGSTSVNTSGDLATTGDIGAGGDITAGGNVSSGSVSTGSLSTTGGITSAGDVSVTGVGGKVSATNGEFRRLHLLDDQATPHYVEVRSPDPLTANYTLTLPGSLGSANQILGMNNAGNALENKTLTAGTGVTITHSAGGIEIAASGSGGTVTSVTGTAPIIVDNSNPNTPIVSLDDSGVGVGTYGSATEVPVITVDAKGRITSASNTTISGVSPAGSNLATGKAWIGDGTGKATEAYINVSDLKKSDGTPQIPSTCTVSQTMTWSSVTDVFTCSNITVTKSQISDFPALGTAALEDVGTSAGDVVQLDPSGKLPAVDGSQLTNLTLPSYDTTYFKQGGNDFSATATLGTTGNNDLNIITNNTTKMTVLANGNVGIGTTSPASSLYVKGSIGIEAVPSSGPYQTRHYSDLASWSADSAGATGTLKITLPTSWTSTMMAIRIVGYPYYSGKGAWEILVSGYNYSGGSWTSAYVDTRGSAPVPVRLGHDGNKNVILLGEISSGWNLAKVWVADAYVSTGAVDAYGSGWSMELITDETGITSSSIPIKMYRQDGNIGIGTTSPTVSLDLGTKTDAVRLPSGTTAQQPATPSNGMIRYNSQSNKFEAYENGAWTNMIGGTASSASSVAAGAGSAATPSISFSGDTDTGFYSSGADSIGISAGGNKVWDITTSAIVSPTAGGASISSAAGTAAAPTFSFSGDTDTGWYHPAADTLAASTGGTERIRISPSGNVGIGTTNPTLAKLQVEGGSLYLDNDSNGNGGFITEAGLNGIGFSGNAARLSTPDFYVTDAGNVGIGTTTPSEKMNLSSGNFLISTSEGTVASPSLTQGLIRFDNRADGSGNSTANKIVLYDTGLSKYGIGISSSSFDLFAGAGGFNFYTDHIDESTPGSVRMTLTNSGYVGIGTRTPQDELHVSAGNIRLDNTFALKGKDSTGTGRSLIQMTAGDYTSIGDATSAYVLNVKNGNVGIGTIAPAANLQVGNGTKNGSILMGGAPFENAGNGSGYSSIGSVQSSGNLALGRNIITKYSSDTSENTIIRVAAGTINGFTAQEFKANGEIRLYGGNGSTTLNDQVNTDANTRLILDTTGRLGIGTASPGAKLSLRDTTAYTTPKVTGIDLFRDLGAGDFDNNRQGISIDFRQSDSNNSNMSQIRSENGYDSVDNAATNGGEMMSQLVFATSDTTGALQDRMVITGKGNVGIGTTAPLTKLHVVSDFGDNVITSEVTTDDNAARRTLHLLRTRSSTTAPGTGFGSMLALQAEGFTNNSVADVGRISAIWENDQTNDTTDRDSSLVFYTMRDNTTPEVMRVTSAGNVGIGTSTPAAKLDVNGFFRVLGGADYHTGWGIGDAGWDTRPGSGNTSKYIFNQHYGITFSAHSTYGGIRFYNQGTNTGTYPYLSDATMVMAVTNGSVGIGTTSPAQKLDVWGNIAVSGATVHTSDRRLKENITPLENPLQKILTLKGYNYFWKDKSISSRKQIGVIAQEVQRVFPEAVYQNEKTGYYSVNYEGLIPPLIESTKTLYGMCRMTASQTQELSQKVDMHTRQLASMEEKIQRLEREKKQQDQKIEALTQALCALSPQAKICP